MLSRNRKENNETRRLNDWINFISFSNCRFKVYNWTFAIFLMRLINKNTKKCPLQKNLPLVGCKKYSLCYRRHKLHLVTNGEKENLQQSNSFLKPLFSLFSLCQKHWSFTKSCPCPYTEQKQSWRTATRRRRHNLPWDGGGMGIWIMSRGFLLFSLS